MAIRWYHPLARVQPPATGLSSLRLGGNFPGAQIVKVTRLVRLAADAKSRGVEGAFQREAEKEQGAFGRFEH